MKSWSCRKQGPRPNLPRRPGGPRPRQTVAHRVKRLGTNLLCLILFATGGLTGVQVYHLAREGFGELLTLREIRMSGLSHLSREEILARLNVRDHESLVTVSPKALQERLEQHPWIKEARISREPFHRLSVEIHERQPAALLQAPNGTILLDREGAVLTSVPSTAELILPVLVGIEPERLQRGHPAARQSVQQGIRLAALMAQSYEGIPQIDLRDPENAVGYVQGIRFEFGATSFEEKWARYHQVEPTVWPRLGQGGKDLRSEIDLRYPGKVIVRERG